MSSYYRDGKTWTVVYDGRLDGKPKGHRSYIYGLKTEKLALSAKQRKDHQEQLRKAGLYTPEPNAAKRAKAEALPLAEHVDAFRKSILAGGRDPKHAAHQAAHVRRLLDLAGKTKDDVELHRVAGIGQFEEANTQARLKHLLDSGLSPRTVNAARQAAYQFGRFLKRRKFVAHNPFEDLERYNEDADVRRKRRPLSEDEIHWLIDTTSTARDFVSRRCGIPPADRAVLYATGLGTGFRQTALLSLTKSSFHVDERLTRPFVRLGAAFNKNGKDRDQPIRRDLADWLRGWLKSRPDAGPVWPLAPHADLALRFRRDMEGARRAWVAAATGKPEHQRRDLDERFLRYVYHDGAHNVFADFHGLRHTGITLVVRKTRNLRVAQAWADHSTPVLTARYAHLDLTDEASALEALPADLDPARRPAREPQRSGTVRKVSDRSPRGKRRAS